MSDWPTVSIGDVGKVFDGPHATPKTVDEGPVFLGIDALQSGRLVLGKTRHVTQKDFEKWTKRVTPRAGDIVFSYETRLGEAAIIPEGLTCCLGRRMGLVRVDQERIIPEFFLYQYISPAYQRFLKSRTIHGATVDRLALKEFPDFPLSLPPISVQRSILDVLASLDDKIELNRRMNETLEEMARALFRDWFVDFGPTRRQMEGATDPAAIMGHAFPPEKATTLAPLFPAKLGDDGLPGEWEMGRLDDWAVSASNTVKPDEVEQDTIYIGLEHMPRRSIALGQWETAAKVTSNKARFAKGQILFGKLRPYFHKVGIAPCDGICSTDIVVADGRQKEFRPFVTTLMSTNEFVAYTNQSSTGTKMPRTSWKLMRAYEAPKAPQELVTAFGDFAQPMHEKIVHSLSENQTLAEMRDLLLPKLMSGEIRLKDAEKGL